MWFGNHIALICIGRFLQGLASAAVWSVGLALLIDTVGRDHVAASMGWVNIAYSSGSIGGPLIGGVTYSVAGHNAVFALAAGLLVLDLILRLLMIEKRDARVLLAKQSETEQCDDDGSARPLLRERRK